MYEMVILVCIVFLHMPKQPVQFLTKNQQRELQMIETLPPSFSLGKKPPKVKSRRKRPLPQKPKCKVKRSLPTESIFQQPTIRVIPCPQSLHFSLDLLKGKTYIQKMASLYAMKPHIYICSFWKETSSLSSVATKVATIKKECKDYLQKNQKYRWILKRFITLWRLKHLRQLNDVDPITLNSIVQPISVVCFATRGKYVFEASSFLHEIHQKLLQSNGQIPAPVFPRNPLTNQDLSYGQLVSIYNQCLQYGKMKWSFQGFYHARFSIRLFLILHRKSLRVNAVKTVLNTHDNYEGIDMLLDFIETQHEEHEIPYNHFIYRWCVYHLPCEKRISQWRELCRSWYEKDILLDEQIEKQHAFDCIARQSVFFCNPPYELIAKRQLILNKKKEKHHV
jgi:hypothetical protein